MKVKCIVYLFICSTQCIIASENQFNEKTKRAHTSIESRNTRRRTTITLKEDNIVIKIPTKDVLRKRFKRDNYNRLIQDTPILAQLTSKHQTFVTTYNIIDEICTQFYSHTNTDTYLTRLYHRDKIVRIILKDHPGLITKLENNRNILQNLSTPIETK
jgi:hypothetical protein